MAPDIRDIILLSKDLVLRIYAVLAGMVISETFW